MDEIVELLDEFGNSTNKPISKEEAHQKGLWHKAIHVLIVNKDKTKILIQKRTKTKKIYPNIWDISVGGHVTYNEDTLTSAKRELEEELGLNPNNYELKEISKIKESLTPNNLISNEFVTIYLMIEDLDINKIVLQKEEVAEIKWVTKTELNQLVQRKEIIPHIHEYELLNEILI